MKIVTATSLHKVLITPLLANSYVLCGFFLSMKQIQCNYLLTWPLSWTDSSHILLACSRIRSKMQQFGFVPMMKETGHHFFICRWLSITMMNSTRAYFGGQLLSMYVTFLPFYHINYQPICRPCGWFIWARVLPSLAIVLPRLSKVRSWTWQT